MRCCQYCGTQLADDAKFCSHCGKPTAQEIANDQQALIDKLSSRLKTNGIIWVAIAIIQLVAGLSGFWGLLIVGVLNMISAVTDIKNSKRILTDQNGIVKAYEPITNAIIVLIYNLFIGAVIGILGSVYYLIFVRGFVMENKSRFLAMETAAPAQNNTTPDVPNILYTDVVLTQDEATNGVEKEIHVAQLKKTLKVRFPQNIKAGQALALRNISSTGENGETVKKDVHIRISIQETGN